MARVHVGRKIGGHIYYASMRFPTKTGAKDFADNFRLLGYGARVLRTKDGWVVYSTMTKIRKAR
jgi:hypothetical protein